MNKHFIHNNSNIHSKNHLTDLNSSSKSPKTTVTFIDQKLWLLHFWLTYYYYYYCFLNVFCLCYRRSFNIKYVTILSDSSLYKFWWENFVKLGDHDNDLSYLIVPENYKSGQSSCWNGEHHVEQPIKHKLDRLYNLILA